jgi:hypothetical protein
MSTQRRLAKAGQASRSHNPLGSPRAVAFALAALGGAALASGACGGNVVVDTSTSTTGSGASTTGTGGSATGLVSCAVSTAGIEVCAEYQNPPPAVLAALDTACTGDSGTLGQGCSMANVLGSCALTMMGISATEVFYAVGGLAPAEAEMSCSAAGGTWTAG